MIGLIENDSLYSSSSPSVQVDRGRELCSPAQKSSMDEEKEELEKEEHLVCVRRHR